MDRVLVCDDEEPIREALETFLTGEGYGVSLAEDGQKALDEFKKGEYDVVFMDIKMPGIDGIECMREMKKIKPGIKVVIITGIPDETTFDRAVSLSGAAAEGFIAKPFKPNDLRKVLQNILTGRTISTFQLTPSQMEAFSRVGSVGAENASRDFSKVIDREIKVNVEGIRVVPFSGISDYTAGEETQVGMLTKFSGQISGGILILLPWTSGLELVDLMEKRPSGTTDVFSQVTHQILKTAGSILSASCLNAVNSLLKVSAKPEMPELIFDKRSKILTSASQSFNLIGPVRSDEYIFTVENELSIAGTNVKGPLLFMPDEDSIKMMLKKLGTLG